MTGLRFFPTNGPYCGTGCSINLAVRDGRVLGIEPWHSPPINEGKLCQKGIRSGVHSPPRSPHNSPDKERWSLCSLLLGVSPPPNRGEIQILPEEIGCFSSSKASNEDNYLMQKFARLVLKTNNIDNCARLCHSPALAALSQVFGSGAEFIDRAYRSGAIEVDIPDPPCIKSRGRGRIRC